MKYRISAKDRQRIIDSIESIAEEMGIAFSTVVLIGLGEKQTRYVKRRAEREAAPVQIAQGGQL